MSLATVSGFECGEPAPLDIATHLGGVFVIPTDAYADASGVYRHLKEIVSVNQNLRPSIKRNPDLEKDIIQIRLLLGPVEGSFARIALYLNVFKPEHDPDWSPQAVAAFFHLAQMDATCDRGGRFDGHDFIAPATSWDISGQEKKGAEYKKYLDEAFASFSALEEVKDAGWT